MKTWAVLKRNEQWGLYIRDYFCQGVPPDYTLFKQVSTEQARELVRDGLADDIHDRLKREPELHVLRAPRKRTV
jgi:hypothetical protein